MLMRFVSDYARYVLKGGPRFSGNFVTGGAGLPRMSGTAQRKASGGMEARFRLAEYRAGDASVALPDLRLVQLPSGQIGFGGRALVSGALPRASGLLGVALEAGVGRSGRVSFGYDQRFGGGLDVSQAALNYSTGF